MERKNLENEVTLFKQSYSEAKINGFKEDLELVGLVTGTSKAEPFSNKALETINTNLKKGARNLNTNYVFGIDYKAITGQRAFGGGTIGFGDAYRKDFEKSLYKD